MFSTDKSKNETTDENDDDDEDVDDDGVGKEDFLLALFIAQQDPGLTESKPDQNPNKSDPDFGHFCAPWVPGFCKANFCIFHHPINPPGDASNNNNFLENTNAT